MKGTFDIPEDEEDDDLAFYGIRTWPTAKQFEWLHGLLRKIDMESEELARRQKELQEQNDREFPSESNHDRAKLAIPEKKWTEIRAQREAERPAAGNG